MKHKLVMVMLSVALIVGLVLIGCVKPVAPPEEPADGVTPTPEVYTIRFTCSLSPGHRSSRGSEEWCEYIEANSGGRIKVQFFDSGSLYKASDAVEATSIGACEAMLSVGNEFINILPEWEVLMAPGVTDSAEGFARIADGEIGARLMESLERKGLKGIALIPTGNYVPYGAGWVTKCYYIKVPADFAGLKLRAYTPADVEIVSKYGGVPVTMPGSEVFMALELGTIDGTSCGLLHFQERKFQETGAIYYTWCPTTGGTPYMCALNKEFFDKLPSDLQVLLMDSGKRIIDVGTRQMVEEGCELAYQWAIEHGVLVYERTPEELAAWKVEVDLIIENMKAKDPALKELLEMAIGEN